MRTGEVGDVKNPRILQALCMGDPYCTEFTLPCDGGNTEYACTIL